MPIYNFFQFNLELAFFPADDCANVTFLLNFFSFFSSFFVCIFECAAQEFGQKEKRELIYAEAAADKESL